MEYGLHVIETATAETILIDLEKGRGAIKSININNGNKTTEATIDLYLKDNRDQKAYIVKELNIPGGVTLLLNEGLMFNNSVLSLCMKTVSSGITSSNPISVIIK